MRIFTFLLLLVSFTARAQNCAGPGRVPELAIPVCGSLTFHQPDVPTCTGPALPYTNCFAQALSDNSVWYKFHCLQAGTLGFLIAPASASDDYDWHIADVTGHAPQDVFTTNLLVSMNLSANAPNTGCSAAGTTNVNCEGNTDPFNEMPTLIAGHDYLLCVTNWSNSGLGYDLSFSGGTAVLTDLLPPSITSVGIVGCNTSTVKITFSEEILCSSLTATISEFSIISGTHVISSVSSTCTAGSSVFTEILLNLQNPLPAGNYQLIVNNGTDGNTLQDVCQEVIPAGTSIPFTVPVQNPLSISNVIYTGCAPTILKVALGAVSTCNSITASGSEFTITPGNPAIASVQSTCNSGGVYTDTLLIVLQNPLPHGNYQLTVNNGTDGNTLIDTCGTSLIAGYQFPFVINQITTAPVIQSIVFDECKPNKLVVNFDKALSCSSVSPDGTEFSITTGSITVTAAAINCASNNRQVTLQLSGNLIAGNFNLAVNNGSDGNTISDSCFAFMPVNSIYPFTTTQAPAPIYDSLQFDKCTPQEIKVFYNKAINCGSVAAAGLEFIITGPSAVTVASVSGDPATCSTSFSNWLTLHLSQPITVFGTYTLHNKWGPDNNSVMDTCYAKQDTLETISFNVLGKPSAVFTGNVQWGCVEDTIVLSHPGGNAVNSWTWNFSDGTTASGQNVSHNFPISTDTATVELIISNGFCSDTLKQKYPLNNAINAVFTSTPDTACINKNVSVVNNSTGNNLQYLWDFGDNSQSSDLSPVPHVYSTNGNFDLSLIITNDHGCSDTAVIKRVAVTAMPIVEFSGLNAQYCTGEAVVLNANLQGNITSYTWNMGNGIGFNDQPTINSSYNSQNVYTISLTATDRFCGLVKKEATTQVYRIPSFDLGIDKILCPGLTVQIGPDPISGYAYLWSTAATSPKIITAIQSNTYKLEINNNGCIATDEIFVEVLDNCLIKVPGAFTPNRDGLNDRLKAINADLATNFSLRVYNRFGQLVFSTNDPLDGWDGTFKGNPADTGTYVWQVSYIDPVSKKPVYEKGTSILIR